MQNYTFQKIMARNISYIITSMFIFLMLACSSPESMQVRIFGEMRQIMMKGNLSATVRLDTLKGKDLYGIGVREELSGEIIMLDNQVYITSVADSASLSTSRSADVSAALFIATDVAHWQRTPAIERVENFTSLDSIIEQVAIARGINPEKPIAFKIEVVEGTVDGHVIHWKPGIVHTHENHKQFAIRKTLTGRSQLLGFFSKHHQGIFTHHSTFTHIHALGEGGDPVLHVDQLNISKLNFYFPK